MGLFDWVNSIFKGKKIPSEEEIINVVDKVVDVVEKELGDKRYKELIKDTDKWEHFLENDLTVPRTTDELKDLGNFLMNETHTDKIPEYLEERIPEITKIFVENEFENTGEHDDVESEVVRRLYDNYYMAVDKKIGDDEELAKLYRKDLEKKLKGSMLSSQGNFQILYTSTAKQSGYVDRIADNLEKALATYKNTLNVTPYWPHGDSPIVVEVYKFFGKLTAFNGYTFPNYAIEINELNLGIENNEDNDPLEATPAHELFHKIQYNYGYKTEWFKPNTHLHVDHSHTDKTPDNHFHNEEIFSWFSEGTASWGEFYATKNISNPTKMSRMFQNPETPLFQNNAESLPFWNFVFNHIYKDKNANPHPMSIFLSQLLHTKGDVLTTLVETVKKADPKITDMNELFVKFCNYRRMKDEVEVDGEKLSFKSVINSSTLSMFDRENDYLDVSPLACNYHFHKFYQPLETPILITINPDDKYDCLVCELVINETEKTDRLRFNKKEKKYKIIVDADKMNVKTIDSLMLIVIGKMGPKEYYPYQLKCEDIVNA